MIFKKNRNDENGLSDLLNYAHLIDDGVIINKDGAFLMTYKFRGPDINSASGAELDALSENFSRMTTFLDDGWMLHIDELRIPSIVYPEAGYFPEPISAIIDEERRRRFEAIGSHFENIQFMTFVWKFPMPIVKTTSHWFVEGLAKEDSAQNLTNLYIHFRETIDRCVGLLNTQLTLEKLNSEDLLSYLNTCISGELVSVSEPPKDCFIDVTLGRYPVVGGYIPKVGSKHIYVLSIIGYMHEKTIPGLLEEMGTYAMIYRFSNRFVPLSIDTADREIKRYQKNWSNKVKGLLGTVTEAITGAPSPKVNLDAKQMVDQTIEAQISNSNGSKRFGFWSSEIVLMHEDIELLEEARKILTRYLEQSGFSCLKEDVNAFDAWLGTIPGHGSCNLRKLFIDSVTLAHVVPLHSIWAGKLFSDRNSLLPPKSAPVMYASTTGNTPYRHHLDVKDVGHQLVLGATGAGKTTYLGLLISQFLRYKDAQVFLFDKDHSHKALTYALGGFHYDIGEVESIGFCPLQDLNTETKRRRAEQYIEDLVCLQNIALTPNLRAEIHTAIESLGDCSQEESRNLTVFRGIVQNELVRSVIQYYTLDGQFKLLDAKRDSLKTGYLQTFEMNWLLQQKPEIYLPTLNHVFNSIDALLEEQNGQRPTLIVFEEFWFFNMHEVARRKLKDWLKTKRKMNARMVLATQSLADLYDVTTHNLTEIAAPILESCPTKIYLPNQFIDEEIRALYRKIGLSDRQIDIITKEAIPKQHYYIVTPEGNRLVDLGFDQNKSIELSFVGLSKKRSGELINLIQEDKVNWQYEWLNHNGFPEWADYCKQRHY